MSVNIKSNEKFFLWFLSLEYQGAWNNCQQGKKADHKNFENAKDWL